MRNQKGRVVHKCTCDTCRNHPCCAVAKEHRAINRVLVTLDERNRRRFAGVLALQWGRGGIQRLNKITGLSRIDTPLTDDPANPTVQIPLSGIAVEFSKARFWNLLE